MSAQLKFYYATARLTNTYIERRFAKTLRVLAAPPFFVCIRDPSPYHSKILASPTLYFLTGKIKSYRLIPPRSRGGSPKEIQQSNKGISFGEKGAGKRKIGAHRRFYVNFLVECRVISQFFAKTFKCHKPKASDGAVKVYSILDRSASVGGRRFCGKEPQRALILNGEYSPLCILSHEERV